MAAETDLGGALVEFAPAKINLTLRILAQRPDGFHDLDSLVVFAPPHDRLTLTPGATLTLRVDGPNAKAAGPSDKNLVLKAARALAAHLPDIRLGDFSLHKALPAAAGIGGGSSDAAAALRLIARANGLALDHPALMQAARDTGADVPVCLAGVARIMRGIGEQLSPPLTLPPLPLVLVNAGVTLATRDVFAARADLPGHRVVGDDDLANLLTRAASGHVPDHDALVAALRASGNDLEEPAIALRPEVGQTLDALHALPGCQLARMSGSGATCFGIFSPEDAPRAAQILQQAQPSWWVQATLANAACDPSANARG